MSEIQVTESMTPLQRAKVSWIQYQNHPYEIFVGQDGIIRSAYVAKTGPEGTKYDRREFRCVYCGTLLDDDPLPKGSNTPDPLEPFGLQEFPPCPMPYCQAMALLEEKSWS